MEVSPREAQPGNPRGQSEQFLIEETVSLHWQLILRDGLQSYTACSLFLFLQIQVQMPLSNSLLLDPVKLVNLLNHLNPLFSSASLSPFILYPLYSPIAASPCQAFLES